MRAIVAHLSSGPHSGIVTLRIPLEQLQLLEKGQELELVLSLSPSLPADAPSPELVHRSPQAPGSEGDLSSPPASAEAASVRAPQSGGSAEAQLEAGGLASSLQPSTDTAELVKSFKPLHAPEAPSATDASAGSSSLSAPAEVSVDWRVGPSEPDWSSVEAQAFGKGVAKNGYDYESIADLCELQTEQHLRPRQLGDQRRRLMYRWVAYSGQGKLAYEAVREGRDTLLRAARALKTKERAAAAKAAGLVETQPAKLSARQLWALLLEAGPRSTAALAPTRPKPPEPEPGICPDCGQDIVWVHAGGEVRLLCDPVLEQGERSGKGPVVTLIGADGTQHVGVTLDPEGRIWGRRNHLTTCKARTGRRGKDAA